MEGMGCRSMQSQIPEEHLAGTKKLDKQTYNHTVIIEQRSTVTQGNRHGEADESLQAGVTGLSVILGQMLTCLRNRAYADDLDVLNFSLHHLFCRVDYLYRSVLPDLLAVSPAPISEEARFEDLLRHQHIWTKLRTIKHTLNRLEPLVHLLSDAAECVLDMLDMTGGEELTRKQSDRSNAQDWLDTLSQEHSDQALTSLMESLASWQENYNDLTLFVDHFSLFATTIPTLIQIDEAFTIILDCAGAIFGDILPGFQAISEGDDDAIATLLFDLIHQSDQLLAQCDSVLEPLHTLIEQFALKSNR